jgi:hypothetical protein
VKTASAQLVVRRAGAKSAVGSTECTETRHRRPALPDWLRPIELCIGSHVQVVLAAVQDQTKEASTQDQNVEAESGLQFVEQTCPLQDPSLFVSIGFRFGTGASSTIVQVVKVALNESLSLPYKMIRPD